MPLAHLIMINNSMVPPFAASLICFKKGFKDCTNEYFTIVIFSLFLTFWYQFYDFFEIEALDLHSKYRKYKTKWNVIIKWDEVCSCHSFATLKKAFCPTGEE